jgi:hypothetical protein
VGTQFWFWLVKTELVPGLLFGTGTQTRTRLSEKNELDLGTRFPVPFICGTRIEIFGEKKLKKKETIE